MHLQQALKFSYADSWKIFVFKEEQFQSRNHKQVKGTNHELNQNMPSVTTRGQTITATYTSPRSGIEKLDKLEILPGYTQAKTCHLKVDLSFV